MLIVVTGPTGTGKTELSLYLAKKLNGEIINADSTQIYKGLDIATNKIKDKQNIPHHLFDIKNITEDYTVFDYQKDARKCIDDILKRKKTPILVGGTGLYIKAALYDYKFANKAQNTYEEYTNEELYQKLLKVD
ncbi:MAG: isopentenyl transferase family protein, partial [Alphaproteobacteria bacterium]|nr:isopentenyl transferase family protein [Alphaproteobacteria bacterium]